MAAAKFEKKWSRNEFDSTLSTAERHALFVPASALRLASRASPVPLFAAQAPTSPTQLQLGIAVDAAVDAQWASFRADVLDWVRRAKADENLAPPAAHTYWRANLHSRPELAAAALRALSVPFSVAQAERGFSDLHALQSDQRLAMGDEYLCQSMFIAGNRHFL